MTGSLRAWSHLVCVLLSAHGALTQQFQLEPSNYTVLLDSVARFNATVQGSWQVMTWRVQGNQVATVPFVGNATSSSDRFSATRCSSGDANCVEFTIHKVTLRDSGPVECAVQGSGDFGTKTSQLYVQESGTVSIMGGNVTVTQEEQVEFQCVMTGWTPKPTVSWTQDSVSVNSSLYNTTSTSTNGDPVNSTSIFKFQAVRNTVVECLATVSALTVPQSSSVFLTVVPKPTDWTVLIAVVVSFGGFALLVLLIIGIIFCYKLRKEKQTTYQDEMSKRVRSMSHLSVVGGQANPGFQLDGQTSVAPSEHTDSGFSQVNGSHVFEMPDVVNSNQAGSGYVDESGFRKHRHVTIV